MEAMTKEELDAYNRGFAIGERTGHIRQLEKNFGKPPGSSIDWEALTVGDVADFSKMKHSKLNIDSCVSPFQIPDGTLVWGDNNHRIAVFWVTGSSEGYYVHVETTSCKNPQTLMIGKCWDVSTAETMVRDLTRFIWDEWRN